MYLVVMTNNLYRRFAMAKMLIAVTKMFIRFTSVLSIALGLALVMGVGAALVFESRLFDSLLLMLY